MIASPAPLTAAPTIETARLRLRQLQPSDFAVYHQMSSDERVYRYIGGKPSTEEEDFARILRLVGHWVWRGFGYWLVEEKAAGRFVGVVGFGDFKRDLKPSIQGIPEIGWVLSPQAHGLGYATEAARAALAWGEARHGWKRTACIIDPRNQPSLRVAEKCGFRVSEHTTYKGEPTVLLFRSIE